VRQQGSALIGVLLLASAASAIAATATLAVGVAAQELRERRAVLCAHYAARGAAVLGARADGRPDLFATSLTSLSVVVREHRAHSCLITATARCGRALRSVERRLHNDSRCD